MKRVLVVEDDKINAYITRKFLEKNYEVEIAETPELALDKVSAQRFDLVLMDINLGREEFTGVDLLKIIRKNTTFSGVPVIALTAYAMQEDRDRFLSEGFDQYLSKPVKKEQLIAEIESLTPQEQ